MNEITVKTRHKVVFAILKPFFRLYFKICYNYRYKKFKVKKGENYIILSNHVTTLDPFFLSVMLNVPVYFVASDQLFNLGFVSRLIKFLVSPIPKSKGMSDLACVKAIYSVAKQGGSVGIFPEGNRTFTGETCNMPKAIGKLLKLCKKPIMFVNLHGGFMSKPRFAASVRRGKMSGEIKRIVTYDEIKSMTDEEVNELVRSELSVSAYRDQAESPAKYKSRRSAEYLEHVLYVCPKCKGVATMRSRGNRYICEKCGAEIVYNEYGGIEDEKSGIEFKRILDWYNWENQYLADSRPFDRDANEKLLSDSPVKFFESFSGERRKLLGTGEMALYSDRLEFKFEKGGGETIPLSEIAECAPQTIGKMQIYLKDGRVLVPIARENVSVLKYVVMIHIINNHAEGKSNEFLGL